MEDSESVATLVDSTSSKIHQLQKAFAELESHHAITLNLKWKEIEEHFHGLQRSLKRRFDELESQEKEFEAKTRNGQEMLGKREAAVLAKEEASFKRLQEKRDVATVAIANAVQKHKKTSSMEPAAVSNDDQWASPSIEDQPPDSVTAGISLDEFKASSEYGSLEALSYPQLVKLCQDMNSEGLHKFVSDNRKDLAVLREEIPRSLRAAGNPAQLVLDSLSAFYPMEASNLDGKKDSGLLGLRRTCIMLLECLSILLLNSDSVYVSDILSEDVKGQAKAIAEEWKQKLDALDIDACNGNSLEAHAFLQLLATFCVASDFDVVELSRLIPTVSRRRQVAELCRFLGLAEKMPGVIEVLINSGRQIDAVNMAFAFELTEQFPPVPLLKSYLREARKSSSPVKSGNISPTTLQNEVNDRELVALKGVIKCIEEHKLEELYPVDSLQKRLLLLEKAKADKKRAPEVAKPQPKRPRANGVVCGVNRSANFAADTNSYSRVTDKYQQLYVYDNRPYAYPTLVENQIPFMASATYNFCSSHGNYIVNGYVYPAPYHH